MRTERPEPILPARDLGETLACYGSLGFRAWRGSNDYEILSRGNLVVHFFHAQRLAPAENHSSCYWRVTDADLFHREFAKLGLPPERIPRLHPPEDKPWGMREFVLTDPSRNEVRVGHDLGDAYIPE